VGLFGHVSTGALIEVVELDDVDFAGNEKVGGLAGGPSIVENSFAVGEVTGNQKLGGLAGRVGIIRKSYAGGQVNSSDEYAGGLIGRPGTAEDKDTTGQTDEGKGEPRSTMEMKQPGTFEDWDFASIWDIKVGESHLFLQWYPGSDPFLIEKFIKRGINKNPGLI